MVPDAAVPTTPDLSGSKVQIHFFIEKEWRDVAQGLRTAGLINNFSDELIRLYKTLLLEKISEVTPDHNVPMEFYEVVAAIRDDLVSSSEKQISTLSTIAEQAKVVEERRKAREEHQRLVDKNIARINAELDEMYIDAICETPKPDNLILRYATVVQSVLSADELRRALSINSDEWYLRYLGRDVADHAEGRPEVFDELNSISREFMNRFGSDYLISLFSFVARYIRNTRYGYVR